MINFGTSAYLKLIALNSKPRNTELRKRLSPTKEGGYDFHKRMRQIVRNRLRGTWTDEQAEAALQSISKKAERESAEHALKRALASKWIIDSSAEPDLPIKIYTSPRQLFTVKFEPDLQLITEFGIGQIHLWNTQNPHITHRDAAGLLGLFANEADEVQLGVESLRAGATYWLTFGTAMSQLAINVAIDVEERILALSAESLESKDVYGSR